MLSSSVDFLELETLFHLYVVNNLPLSFIAFVAFVAFVTFVSFSAFGAFIVFVAFGMLPLVVVHDATAVIS